MMRVLIADDHQIVRQGLKDILQLEFEAVVCGEAHNAQTVLNQLRRESWDLLILDVSMPGRSGIDLLGDLRKIECKPRILVFSMHPEEEFGRRVLQAGAQGYLNKGAPMEELITAIRKVMAGELYVSPELAQKLARDLAKGGTALAYEGLSEREFEVLRALASGKTIKQIAEDLHLAGATISTYRRRIKKKTHLASTAQLVKYALDNHLLE
jgi:DNA-binding NarL/FixJ family response regulator